jgi:hypothetical protein
MMKRAAMILFLLGVVETETSGPAGLRKRRGVCEGAKCHEREMMGRGQEGFKRALAPLGHFVRDTALSDVHINPIPFSPFLILSVLRLILVLFFWKLYHRWHPCVIRFHPRQ